MTRALSSQVEQPPAGQPAEPALSTATENADSESTPNAEAAPTPGTTAEPAPSAASPVDAPQDSPTSPRPPPSQRPSHQKLRHPMTQRRQTLQGLRLAASRGGLRRRTCCSLRILRIPCHSLRILRGLRVLRKVLRAVLRLRPGSLQASPGQGRRPQRACGLGGGAHRCLPGRRRWHDRGQETVGGLLPGPDAQPRAAPALRQEPARRSAPIRSAGDGEDLHRPRHRRRDGGCFPVGDDHRHPRRVHRHIRVQPPQSLPEGAQPRPLRPFPRRDRRPRHQASTRTQLVDAQHRWFETARTVVEYADTSGEYADLREWMKRHNML